MLYFKSQTIFSFLQIASDSYQLKDAKLTN